MAKYQTCYTSQTLPDTPNTRTRKVTILWATFFISSLVNLYYLGTGDFKTLGAMGLAAGF